MSEMCCKKTRIPGSWPRYKPCKNKAVIEVEGNHYCGVHDPIRRAKKDAERDAAWREKSRILANEWRLNNAAPDLLRELEHLSRCLGPWIDEGNRVPGISTLNGARSAIAKAKGEA